MSGLVVKRTEEEIVAFSDQAQAMADGEQDDRMDSVGQTVLDVLAWLQGANSSPL